MTIDALQKDLNTLLLKINTLTAVGKEILQEKGITLDDDATLIDVVQGVEKITSGGSGEEGDGTILKVLYSSLSNENNLVLRGVDE